MSIYDSRVFFWLVPKGARAEEVLAHPNNTHLITWCEGQRRIGVGAFRSEDRPATLATLGRAGDIYVDGSSTAKVQCSFEIDSMTNVIMFWDRSRSHTSHVLGKNATPFEPDQPRKVVVQSSLNTTIGLGGGRHTIVMFDLEWTANPAQSMEKTRTRDIRFLEENPRLAGTIIDVDTVLPSRLQTRIHTPGFPQHKIRYGVVQSLGSGQCAEVRKVVDAYTGQLMALKTVKNDGGLSAEWKERVRGTLRREVDILSQIKHVSVKAATSMWT